MIRYLFCLVLCVLGMQGCGFGERYRATPYTMVPESSARPSAYDIPEEKTPGVVVIDNPAVQGLSDLASRQIQNGMLGAAVQTLERGLRIAPKEAVLWSQLASVKLRQHQYEQARSFAAKSSSLTHNTALLHRNRVIVESAQ